MNIATRTRGGAISFLGWKVTSWPTMLQYMACKGGLNTLFLKLPHWRLRLGAWEPNWALTLVSRHASSSLLFSRVPFDLRGAAQAGSGEVDQRPWWVCWKHPPLPPSPANLRVSPLTMSTPPPSPPNTTEQVFYIFEKSELPITPISKYLESCIIAKVTTMLRDKHYEHQKE